MRKTLLTLTAVLAIGFANAQNVENSNNGFSQGQKFLEGSFSFKSSDNENPTGFKSSYAFTPKMGYMVSDKVALGGFLNFSGQKFNNNDKSGVFGIGAFVRYYFLSLGETKSFNAYGEVGLGYSAVKVDPNLGNDYTNSAMNANVDLGMNYFITRNWAVVFTLANVLAYNNANPENGSNTSDLEVNVNLFNNIFTQPQFGLLYRW